MVVCREGRRRVPAEPCCGARLTGDVARGLSRGRPCARRGGLLPTPTPPPRKPPQRQPLWLPPWFPGQLAGKHHRRRTPYCLPFRDDAADHVASVTKEF